MAPSRQIPTESSSYTPAGEGERGMADIFAPAAEPKSELAKYRLLAPKCGRKLYSDRMKYLLIGSTSLAPLYWSYVYWRPVEGFHG